MADLLFELRCEELPPRAVRAASEAMREALWQALSNTGLRSHGTAALWTPRRIALFAAGLADRTPDREERAKGPRVSAAFDAAGKPTRAAEGFARKCGVDPAALERDGDFVWATVKTPGRGAAEIVAEILPSLPSAAAWRKTMRWGVAQTFARPIRGVVALLGTEVVPCEVAGLAAGRTTRGHPFLSEGDVTLASADRAAYVEALREASVLADPEERKATIASGVRAAAGGADLGDEGLVEEITNMVERPSALLGRFDARYLALPPRLLVTVMAHHQRFFPVRDGDGKLRPEFVAILDRGPESADVVRHGFERVLVPRLHDAVFFFEEDRRSPLRDRLDRLKDVTYHRKLGSLHHKTLRLRKLAAHVARALGQSDAAVRDAAAAAELAKCDLVTLLVGEFPELQGHVGSVYAAAEGAPAGVAEAIDWQYRHDFSDAETPGPTALALLLAENLDIVCQFGTHVGLPSGSTDPFGVRRAALALLDACDRWAPTLDVRELVTNACRIPPTDPDGAPTDADPAPVLAYLDTRLRQRHRDRGALPDHLDAIVEWRSVGDFDERVQDLQWLAADEEFDLLLEVAERCRNITKKSDAPASDVQPDLLREPAEQALWESWRPLRESTTGGERLTREDVRRIASTLAKPLHRFFDEVLVNAESPALRTNRHALLREIDGTLLRFADLCRIVRRRG